MKKQIKFLFSCLCLVFIGCATNRKISIGGAPDSNQNRFFDSTYTHFICFNCQTLDSLINYPFVQRVDIFGKQCKIKFDLSKLSNLTELYISSPKIQFKKNIIGNLTKIENFAIYNSQVDKIPYFLTNSVKLKRLHLNFYDENLSFEELKNLNQLQCLELTFNKLAKFPSGIFGLDSLKILDVRIESDNQPIKLPDEVVKLHNLEELRFPFDIYGNIDKLNKLKSLKSIIAQKFSDFEKEYYKLSTISKLENIYFQDISLEQRKHLAEIIHGIDFRR
ncbi:MAG: leucine-rich repeat domain-containing protein [Lewinella sp.]|nr:leucine-rich repeat domain-containing protein [Lewinella sp.]